ncbi:MAG: ABC transporter permease [Pseudonocardiaceae bacterium]
MASTVGLAAGTIGLCVAVLTIGNPSLLGELGWLLLILFGTAVACAGLGFGIGAFSLRLRDNYLPANLTISLMLVLCGIIAPVGSLPHAAQLGARVLPLTSCIEVG